MYRVFRLAFIPLLAVALALPLVSLTRAGILGCAHCGHGDTCQRVCRLVCEEKKVEITCWGVKCEHFCVPGHSKRDCKHHEFVCDECEKEDEDISTRAKKFVWYEWIPGCAKVQAKKKLMRKTVTRMVPSYKWVVEDLCEKCRENAPVTQVEPGAKVPPPPVLIKQ